jgi:hypothetical protein
VQVFPTRPSLNTSVLKWKRVSGIPVGPCTVLLAICEDASQDPVRLIGWAVIDLVETLPAIYGGRAQQI